jgi:phage repressor protein C with HTH and peptisase S24 domain
MAARRTANGFLCGASCLRGLFRRHPAGLRVPGASGAPAAAPPAVSTLIRPAGPEPTEVTKEGEGWPDVGDEWMDVRGVAQGGKDGAFYFEDVISQVRRPPGIQRAKNVTALNVCGDSMEPRYRAGVLVYVQLREPIAGDDVVVELYPEHEGDAPKAFLKELVEITPRRIVCKQHHQSGRLSSIAAKLTGFGEF